MTHVRKAGPDDEILARIAAWVAQLAPELRTAFLATVVRARRTAPLAELERAIAREDLDYAVNLLVGPPGGALWAELSSAFRAAVTNAAGLWAGQLVLEGIGPVLNVGLTAANPRVLQYLKSAELGLIQQISATTREGIRQYLTASVLAGRNPTAQITQLAGYVQPNGSRSGGIIGLTARQAQAVSNYRKYLEALDPLALERALRDKRFDARVETAIANGTPLPPEYIDKLVRRYEANYLLYRAETIARTEAQQALALGQRMIWDTAIEEGRFTADQLIKRWVSAEDERVRPHHVTMHDKTAEYHAEFVLPDGRTTWGPPFDPNCRCVNWIRPKVRRVI